MKTDTVSGPWGRRMTRFHDEEGPFHLLKDNGAPSCGASYYTTTGPYPYQPERSTCCARCLKIYDTK